MQNLFDLSIDMLGVAADGRMTSVNPAWTEQLGWSSDELTTRPFLSFVHPDDAAETLDQIRKLMQGQSSTNFRNRLEHKDGTYRHIQWSLRPHGDFVYLGGRDISVDVSLQHRVERSEAIAVAILHTAADPIVIIDVKGKILHVNKATSELFGYRDEELLEQNVKMLMPEPYRSEHDGYLARFLAEGDPRIIGIGREVEALKADGTIFPMALAVSEAITAQDHLFTGIIHDLTERNRQRDELAHVNAELENRVAERTSQLEDALEETRRSNRDLEQFAYVASHDLQAPLRNVRQGLELLDEHLEETMGASFDDEAQELRRLVVEAAIRMEDLIKGLLTFSRVQTNLDVEKEPVSFNLLVGQAIEQLAADVHEVSAAIDVDPLPTLAVNAVQFRQVFQNLLQNAIRYRSPDQPLEITVRSEAVGDDGVQIIVSDNGIGIEAINHERIFDLFRRGNSSAEGVGLGLSICRRVVEAHGGRIWVESAMGEGASFSIELDTSPEASTAS